MEAKVIPWFIKKIELQYLKPKKCPCGGKYIKTRKGQKECLICINKHG